MSVRKNTLDGLFSGIEDITDAKGRLVNIVLYNRMGNYSSIFEIENPVRQYCTDADQYYAFMNVLDHILQTLGEGYALQKQDIFCRQKFHHEITPGMEFLTESYFRYYEGRPYTEIRTFIVITQETRKSTFVAYDPKKWAEFQNKIQKVKDILEEKGLKHHLLNRQEIDEYLHRFMAFDFRRGPFGMTNLKCTDDSLKMGDRLVKSFSLVDIDVIDLPTVIHPVQTKPVNGYPVSTDLLSFLSTVPLADCVVYNQDNAGRFNTIEDAEKLDDPLIKAMIDQTTKAHEGTRLRFKLLDDVIVKGTKLKKGTYLYGTVTGFGQQRVMADITSILVKDKFLKIHLSVYDLDGMQGFYVPESAFRDMMKNAGSAAMQSNISFDSGGSSGISAEALALQALQNVYQSTSSAVSQAIKKNRAMIKYNTIVYLINEQ